MTTGKRTGPAARTNKGHPRRVARRDRAAERLRLLAHVNNPARCKGGPIALNALYMVGEEGPEVIVPNLGGIIIPNGGCPKRADA